MGKTNHGIAIVTGASTGIGLVTAHALQNAGFRVFGTSRRVGAERPDGVTMLTCDVTDDASVTKLVDEVLSKAGASTCSSTMPALVCSAAQKNPQSPRPRRCST
jgi:NAD(P)-dependent dehydrogenase (short-subunit alcohol dehydrogenase family)